MIGWGRVAARPCDLTLSVPLYHHRVNGGGEEGAREINMEDKLCESKGDVGTVERWMLLMLRRQERSDGVRM